MVKALQIALASAFCSKLCKHNIYYMQTYVEYLRHRMINKAAFVYTKPKQDARKRLPSSLMDKQIRSYCHRARRCTVCKSSRLPNWHIFRSTDYKRAKSIPRSISTIYVNYFKYFAEPFRPHPHTAFKNYVEVQRLR